MAMVHQNWGTLGAYGFRRRQGPSLLVSVFIFERAGPGGAHAHACTERLEVPPCPRGGGQFPEGKRRGQGCGAGPTAALTTGRGGRAASQLECVAGAPGELEEEYTDSRYRGAGEL